MPLPNKSGAVVRIMANVESYLKLGYKVHLYIINKSEIDIQKLHSKFKNDRLNIKHINEDIVDNRSVIDRILGAKPGYLFSWILDIIDNRRVKFRDIVMNNKKHLPGAIHHFEYLHNASIIIGLKGNYIWSNHDLASKRLKIISKLGYKRKTLMEKVLIYFKYNLTKMIEYHTINSAKLVFTVSSTECAHYKKIGGEKVKLLPYYFPESPNEIEKKYNLKNKIIKMLHLGSLDAKLPYLSLHNIIKHIYPLINSSDLNLFELNVVGSFSKIKGYPWIEEACDKYKNIKLLGYIENLESIWRESDVLLVASDIEIGIRTKIIESIRFKVPVLAMCETAKGIKELENNKNILLANDFEEFLNYIVKIYSRDIDLKKLADNAYRTVGSFYSKENNLKILKTSLESI